MNKHAFERSILNGIPFHEAVGFFHRIKTAGWGEPPDETGALEGAFSAPVEQVIQALTDVITAKFQLMLAYHIYSQSMRGVAQHACAEVFLEHAEQERAAAEAYLKRAAVLGGGPVHLPEVEPPPASADPVGILMIMARAEQEGIAAQHQLKQLVGEDNPLSFQIEQFMIEDQHHLDELWQLMPQDVQHSPVTSGGDADPAAAGDTAGMEVPPELPEAAPEEELPEEEAPPPPAAAAGGLPPAEEDLVEEELPMEEDPPMEASPPADKPKPKADKPKEKEPSEAKKEAFAIGLVNLLLKQAGMAEDIINGMSPEDKKGLLREEKLRSVVDAVPLKARGLVSSVRSAAAPLATQTGSRLLRGGAALGGILGASGGAQMTKTREKQLRAGGPISRFRADHPTLTGAGLGAATGASAMAGGLMTRGLAPVGALVGGVLPGAALSIADRALKGREDRLAAEEQLKQAFARGLRKLGFGAQGMPEPGAGTDPGAAPMPDTQNAVMPQPSMAAPGPQPPMATPPGARQYVGTNYLEAEETARRAQAENETGFYRDQAQQAQQSAASMGEQVQQIQGQLDQLSAQAAESQNQIMQANQEATTANDQMLNQATLAARMRMGMQQLRAQMMEIASQDPEQLAAAAGGPTPMDVGNQAQMAQGGAAPPGGDPAAAAGGMPAGGDPAVDPATGQPLQEPGAQPGTPDGATPDAAAQGGSTPSGAGGSESKSSPEPKEEPKKDGGETTVSIKKGSAPLDRLRAALDPRFQGTIKTASTLGQELLSKAPYMAIGAGAGAIAAVHQGTKVKSLREQVDALKGQQDGGFAKTLELAKAHMALSQAEEAKNSPYRTALGGGLSGAGLGAAVGTALPWGISGAKRLSNNINTLRGPL